MRCGYCEWKCELGGGRLGVCRAYREAEGRVVERFPLVWSSCGAARIESVPLYHAYPGSRSLVLGTAGCTFRCKYCSNGFIAKEDPAWAQAAMRALEPERIVATARRMGCTNLVFNVNEPTVALQSLAELARAARPAGLPMGCLTNAYTSESGTELLADLFSFFNISLKGLSDRFNREYLGIPSVDPVLRNIRRLAQRAHVEIATPVIQGVNDGELEAMADLIAGIDPEIPWHVFRLLPEDAMKDQPYPSIEAIDRALEAVRDRLPYVYFHNFVGSDWVDTRCPACSAVVIERFSLGCGGDLLQRNRCRDGACPECGHRIRLLGAGAAGAVRA